MHEAWRGRGREEENGGGETGDGRRGVVMSVSGIRSSVSSGPRSLVPGPSAIPMNIVVMLV